MNKLKLLNLILRPKWNLAVDSSHILDIIFFDDQRFLPGKSAKKVLDNNERIFVDHVKNGRITLYIPEKVIKNIDCARQQGKQGRGIERLDEIGRDAFGDLFDKLFEQAKILMTTPSIIQRAKQRSERGDPPRDKNYRDDGVVWESLLEKVPSALCQIM